MKDKPSASSATISKPSGPSLASLLEAQDISGFWDKPGMISAFLSDTSQDELYEEVKAQLKDGN
eukprot:CAMPEP_0170550534 /NCGR_PEP_ID=MMETSP0211-20121228/8592_1 /TAXON_ID=311385 /ORGANISM="Pseudokeronopsis sp., Strain OXSARD2" /LENGTH=63 /DNA_ID=CAMNT_0010857141 /DNA_START=407 /DNA_END=598 /DNA_ORIENTATION=-